MKLHRVLVAALVLLAAACAAAPTGGPSQGPRPARDLITHEQLMDTQVQTLFDAVQRLRPGWLRPSGRGFDTEIGVFMNGARVGNIDYLRQVPVSQVQEVRYLNSRAVEAELTSRQASGIGSAIMITGRRM